MPSLVMSTANLRAACSGAGDLHEVQRLVQQGVSATAANNSGSQPIHAACHAGHLEIAQWLVQQGASATAADNNGRQPIHWACIAGHLDIAQWLVQQGASATAADNNGMQPIHIACNGGRFEIVQWLVQQGVSATAANDIGSQPIHAACQAGHLQIAQWLVQQGASATAADKNGRQPIHAACIAGHLGIAQWLVQQGASATAAARGRNQPIHAACNGGHLIIAQWLVQQGASATAAANGGIQPIHAACNGGHLDIAQWLVQQGASATAADNSGKQPIHIACHAGHLNIVQWLVQQGVSATAAMSNGMQPIQYACFAGHLDIVQWLVQQNPAQDLTRALQYARLKGHKAVVDFLESTLAAASGTPVASKRPPSVMGSPAESPMAPPSKRPRLAAFRVGLAGGDGGEVSMAGTPQLPDLPESCLSACTVSIPYVPFPETWDKFTSPGDVKEGTFRWWQQQQLVEVDRASDEFASVEAKLQRDMPTAHVQKLERIQHRRLWQQYWTKREYIQSKNGGEANETWAWHGTGSRKPEEVLENEDGLDVRFANSAFYGRGIYLSESAVYQTSGRYAHWCSEQGPMQLLLVKVALGAVQELGQTVSEQTRAMSMPVERGRVPGCGVIRYDSVRAGPHRPWMSGDGANSSIIYVVYKTEQVSPSYVVTYQTNGGQPVVGPLLPAAFANWLGQP